MRTQTIFSTTTCALALALAGCGGDDGDPGMNPDGSCSAETKGFTSCGTGITNTCQPGQYCDQPEFAECASGCLSDVNCACNQTCIFTGGDPVGVCRSNPSTQCGNGVCENGETAAGCASDCATPQQPECGDGVCETGETQANCASDCGTAQPMCGNGVCEAGEDPMSCEEDCAEILRAQAREICRSFDFFDCFNPGELQSCYDSVARASVPQLQQYINCGGTGAVSCDDCSSYLP